MRYYFYRLAILLFVPVVMNSCLKGDDIDPLRDVDDGIYIKGMSTTFENFDQNARMKSAVNEVNGQHRDGLYEIFIAVSSAGDGFSIIVVEDHKERVLGPAIPEIVNLQGEDGQIYGTVQKGIFGPDAGTFTVPESGIYHIVIDLQTERYLIAPVSDLSLYGDVVGGQMADTGIPLSEGFDKINMVFRASGLELEEGEFRIRYGSGDRIKVSGSEISVSTSFGGTMTGSQGEMELSMVTGGNSYQISSGNAGIYLLSVNWTVGDGFSANLTETGLVSYPENLYVIGDGISTLSGDDAWSWDMNDYEMIPVHGRPHLFWKIVWLRGSGSLRFSPLKEWGADFGIGSPLDEGVYQTGADDLTVPDEEGYYMITINLNSGQLSVTIPEVYLIGDAVGSWDTQIQEARMIVYNDFEILRLQRFLNAGNIRMYAWHPEGWFTHWYQTEFNVYNGNIEFRGNGPNMDPVPVTSGIFIIELNFRTGSGSVERCDCSP